MRKTYNKGERVYVITHAHQTYTLRGRTVINEVIGPFRVVNTTLPCDNNEGTWHKLQLYGGKVSQWMRSWTLFADKDEAERYVFFLGTICLHPLNCDILRLAFEHSRAEMHRRGIALDCDDPLDESGDDDDEAYNYDYDYDYMHNYNHNFLNGASREDDENDENDGNSSAHDNDTRSSAHDNVSHSSASNGSSRDNDNTASNGSLHDNDNSRSSASNGSLRDTVSRSASDSHSRTPKTTKHI